MHLMEIAEKVRLFSKRKLHVFTTCYYRSHRIVFSLKIFACFRFHSNKFTFITCPVNSFILWDEISVEKSVIWVVFKHSLLIQKIEKYSFLISFRSNLCPRKQIKLKEILVLHPKIRNQRLNDQILPGKLFFVLFFLNFSVQISLFLNVSVVCK